MVFNVTDVVASSQMVWTNVEAVTTGNGSTVTSKFTGLPTQPLAVGVIIYRTTPIALVVLVNVSLIVPLPVALKPVTVPEVTLAVQL